MSGLREEIEVLLEHPTWHRGMYGCPDDMIAARVLRQVLTASPDDTVDTHPTDADRLAAVLALCEERNDYGVLSISQVRAAAGGGS